ncbi:MAG: LPS biosynthesis protein [Armatimonadetes bacterium]|nr:LPS biosynthesis protein [Armatimonadota bacterium]
MIDDHPLEQRAMELFRRGDVAEARRLQEQFLAEVLNSGEDYCSCPGNCAYHGRCVECVLVHRGHADHLPHCFRGMVNRRLGPLSALTENSLGTTRSES